MTEQPVLTVASCRGHLHHPRREIPRHASSIYLPSQCPALPFQRRTSAVVLGALIALVGAPAFAVSPFEGRYQGRGEGQLALQVFALDDGSDTHFVLAETALMNQCTGDLRGLARPSGPMTLVLRKTEPGAEETCTLTLRFSADRARVRMEETGCSTYHGAACAFDGSLKRR